MFANDLRDWGSIPGRVLPKTQKRYLYASLLNTQHYKVRIKSKWSNPGRGVASSTTPRCRSYWKGNLLSMKKLITIYFYERWDVWLYCTEAWIGLCVMYSYTLTKWSYTTERMLGQLAVDTGVLQAFWEPGISANLTSCIYNLHWKYLCNLISGVGFKWDICLSHI